ITSSSLISSSSSTCARLASIPVSGVASLTILEAGSGCLVRRAPTRPPAAPPSRACLAVTALTVPSPLLPRHRPPARQRRRRQTRSKSSSRRRPPPLRLRARPHRPLRPPSCRASSNHPPSATAPSHSPSTGLERCVLLRLARHHRLIYHQHLQLHFH
ncbi:hypothetical protein B0H13DRAFT_2286388, partial [Mycena leptocephala]